MLLPDCARKKERHGTARLVRQSTGSLATAVCLHSTVMDPTDDRRWTTDDGRPTTRTAVYGGSVSSAVSRDEMW